MNSGLVKQQSLASIVSLLVCPWLLIAGGCSKEKMDEMVNTVKVQAQTIAESPVIAEVIPATGRAEVRTSPPVQMTEAHARFYAIGDGRPGVVQWTSYDPTKGPNTYPALLVRANTSATSLEGIAGQTLTGRIFFQQAYGSPVLATPDGALVDITIPPLDPKQGTINATLGSLTLMDPKGQPANVSGISLEGLLP